ncbi:aminoglycoside 2'-N-acetyltransferase [Streptomyces caniferus]|uniref:Aminoglycoside 2'-N-acetyltransferase n=2 Tax=Streptomyces caniferus TaxID=285557 RepID=A0A640S0Y3_9ACTN|nr:aminoglycoside 2'-N-acetyltransferase [Streptomyces caniferus]
MAGKMPSPGHRPTATMTRMTEAHPTASRTPDVRIAHTADLDPATLKAARALLYDVFDDMTAEDWEHSLGGLHALVHEDGELIGHAAVVQRRLLHGGRALRCGYVEGVAVRADRRGRGHGAALMDVLERVVRGGYDLGALGAAEEAAPFYAARGWQLWRGRSWALTPDGIRRTADEDGCLYVLPTAAAPLQLDTDLTCDWRDGDLW